MLTPQRTDARRNREAILRVADEAFAEGSAFVSLDEIARRAGLGRATVYRHFPDRQALGAAVAAQQFEALRRALGASDADRCAFRDVLGLVLAEQVARRPLVHLLRELPVRDQQQHADALIGALTPAFLRAQAEGLLRQDAEPADLVLILQMVDAAAESVPEGPGRDATLRRIVAVLLDGLFVAS